MVMSKGERVSTLTTCAVVFPSKIQVFSPSQDRSWFVQATKKMSWLCTSIHDQMAPLKGGKEWFIYLRDICPIRNVRDHYGMEWNWGNEDIFPRNSWQCHTRYVQNSGNQVPITYGKCFMSWRSWRYSGSHVTKRYNLSNRDGTIALYSKLKLIEDCWHFSCKEDDKTWS